MPTGNELCKQADAMVEEARRIGASLKISDAEWDWHVWAACRRAFIVQANHQRRLDHLIAALHLSRRHG